MKRIYGYSRISSPSQSLLLQNDALIKAGCEKIFSDTMTGSVRSRPELDKLLSEIRPGDKLIVYKLDRLGRNFKHLMELVEDFKRLGINFESLQEKMATDTPTGTLVFHIFGALAEFERGLIRERCNAGIEAKKARGGEAGRPPALNKEEIKELRRIYHSKVIDTKDILVQFKITKSTMYKYVRE